jgi:hypothetical protein
MNSHRNLEASRGFEEQSEIYASILPVQYRDIAGGYRRSDPERDLMFAVLEDGIRCYLAGPRVSKELRRRFEEAQSWIMERGDRGPFSFDTLCQTFDIEPERLRSRLQSLSLAKVPRRFRNRAMQRKQVA